MSITEKRIRAAWIAGIKLCGINLIWMGLELILYGEVQHRVVDDIMALFIFYSLYLNALHYIERLYGKL